MKYQIISKNKSETLVFIGSEKYAFFYCYDKKCCETAVDFGFKFDSICYLEEFVKIAQHANDYKFDGNFNRLNYPWIVSVECLE